MRAIIKSLLRLIDRILLPFDEHTVEYRFTEGDYRALETEYRDAVRHYRIDVLCDNISARVFEHHLMMMDTTYYAMRDMANHLYHHDIDVGEVPLLHAMPYH